VWLVNPSDGFQRRSVVGRSGSDRFARLGAAGIL